MCIIGSLHGFLRSFRGPYHVQLLAPRQNAPSSRAKEGVFEFMEGWNFYLVISVILSWKVLRLDV